MVHFLPMLTFQLCAQLDHATPHSDPGTRPGSPDYHAKSVPVPAKSPIGDNWPLIYCSRVRACTVNSDRLDQDTRDPVPTEKGRGAPQNLWDRSAISKYFFWNNPFTRGNQERRLKSERLTGPAIDEKIFFGPLHKYSPLQIPIGGACTVLCRLLVERPFWIVWI